MGLMINIINIIKALLFPTPFPQGWVQHRLEKGAIQSWDFAEATPLYIRAEGDGLLWITIEGVSQDYFLGPESCVRIEAKGRVVLETLIGGRFALHFGEPSEKKRACRRLPERSGSAA